MIRVESGDVVVIEPIPSVSVVTINRNTGNAAECTLISLREQTECYTWVVIDGASADHSGELLRTGLRPGDVYLSEKDQGIADAFNKGIKLAPGRAIVFLNAGDAFTDSQALSRLVKAWHEGVAPWVTGGASVSNDKGEKLYQRCPRHDLAAKYLLKEGCRIWHAATLIDRSLFEKYGGFDTTFKIAMDYEMWLRLHASGVALRLVEEPVCTFHLGGISSQLSARLSEDRRARQLHHMANSWLIELKLALIVRLKLLIRPVSNEFFYKVKEWLGW